MDVNIGIAADKRTKVAEGLARVLADSIYFNMLLQNVHWNITGRHFLAVHNMTEEQYTELREAIDELAERMRALDAKAPGTFRELGKLTKIQEPEKLEKEGDHLQALLAGHETLIATLREVFPTAEDAGDDETVDLYTQRLQVHTKAAWMLRAMLS